jgi:Uma2 family endonuclease
MGSRLPLEGFSPTPEAMMALWDALCEDPSIANLPYKVETNERGQLLMSPTSTPHSVWQAEVAYLLRNAVEAGGLGGKVMTESAVLTERGIRVPDVAWISPDAWHARSNQNLLMLAPTICIEVMSPSNSVDEMAEKTAIYLASGAQEVWILAETGAMSFHDVSGEQPRSRIVPQFPAVIAKP